MGAMRSLRAVALLLTTLLAACAGAPPPAPEPPAAAAPAPAEAPAPPPGEEPPRLLSGATPVLGGDAWEHDWVRGAVFYEVFVRSFQDSDGDGVGDLQGLISKLDYLNDGDPATDSDLEVDALWLMPVFESPSYHGYDVVDYESVDAEYGTNEDFRRLLDEAHRRGMRVIVDFVMNHSSSRHPWFVESASSPESPKRDWYVWRPDNPGWKQPWADDRGGNDTWHEQDGAFYYGVFWGGMPDLNFRTPAVREEMKRLAALWLGRGVDGFRLDATRHLFANGPGDLQNDQPQTFEVLDELGDHVRAASPRALLVGENWTETPVIARYYASLPMSFNFPLASAIVEGANAGEAGGIAAKLREMAELYPPGALDAPFLTNHDMPRLATQLGEDPRKLRAAAAVLLTLPGAPFLYYGEEVGLQNGPGREDQHKRTPMPWDAGETGGFTTGRPWFPFAPGREEANVAAQNGDPGSLLSHYRRLIRARKSSAALREGSLTLLSPEDGGGSPLLAFLREHEGERVLAVHNLGSGEIVAGPFDVGGERLEPIFLAPGAAATPQDGGWKVRLPAGGSLVVRVR
jgi:alpha-amylase